jgi:hypothetical protein
MAYLFNNWPTVSYDIKKNNKPLELTNITLRYKIAEVLRDKSAVMYEYNVPDGTRPDIIAYNYYDDASLDWLIILINNYIDPQFEWHMDDRSFETYIRKKYGSTATAKQTLHHYEILVQENSVTFDGIIVPEKRLIVDQETYDSYQLTGDIRAEQVDSYTHEVRLNDERKIIKILDKRCARDIVSTYERLIQQVAG